jgi:non-ribosomal peptide synthetase component F
MGRGAGGLLIDQLGEAAERTPDALLLPALSAARAWATSGAIASWLIAQAFGPDGKQIPVPAGASPERALMLFGALRAGAVVVPGPNPFVFRALARCSIDAAVAERRLHIDATTPARRHGGLCQRHGDLADLADAVALPWDD